MAQSLLAKFVRSSDGATSIEYALIASIIAVSIAASLRFVGNSLQSNLNDVATGFPTGK